MIVGFVDLGAEPSAQLVGDRLVIKVVGLPLVEGVECDEHRAEVRPERVQENRLAADPHRGGDTRDFVRDPIDPVDHGLCALESGRVGELDVDQQVTHVLRWDEAARRPRRIDELLHQGLSATMSASFSQPRSWAERAAWWSVSRTRSGNPP